MAGHWVVGADVTDEVDELADGVFGDGEAGEHHFQDAAAPPGEPTPPATAWSLAHVGQIECVNASASSTVESTPGGGLTQSLSISRFPHQAQTDMRLPVS